MSWSPVATAGKVQLFLLSKYCPFYIKSIFFNKQRLSVNVSGGEKHSMENETSGKWTNMIITNQNRTFRRVIAICDISMSVSLKPYSTVQSGQYATEQLKCTKTVTEHLDVGQYANVQINLSTITTF